MRLAELIQSEKAPNWLQLASIVIGLLVLVYQVNLYNERRAEEFAFQTIANLRSPDIIQSRLVLMDYWFHSDMQAARKFAKSDLQDFYNWRIKNYFKSPDNQNREQAHLHALILWVEKLEYTIDCRNRRLCDRRIIDQSISVEIADLTRTYCKVFVTLREELNNNGFAHLLTNHRSSECQI